MREGWAWCLGCRPSFPTPTKNKASLGILSQLPPVPPEGLPLLLGSSFSNQSQCPRLACTAPLDVTFQRALQHFTPAPSQRTSLSLQFSLCGFSGSRCPRPQKERRGGPAALKCRLPVMSVHDSPLGVEWPGPQCQELSREPVCHENRPQELVTPTTVACGL